MADIRQFSIDIESNTLTEDELEEIIENAGLTVWGISWKATWDNKDYHEGKTPRSYD
jgi:hypothetical protein